MTNPNEAYLDVYIDSIDPLKFRVEPVKKGNSPPLPTSANGDIIFKNDGHPGFHVHFTLQDPTYGYLFPKQSKAKEAIWSQLGNDCPTSGVWDVFKAPKISPDGKTVSVMNPNPSPEQGAFSYTLRVTDGTDWQNLDPGGMNQNGATSRQDNFVTYTAVGVATVAVVVALTETFHITNFFR